MTLKEKVVHGISWSFASRGSSQLLQAAFSIALARLLGPSEFGLIGMLIVFIGFAQTMADCGLNSALIHNQQITERHRSTVFWIQLAVGASFSTFFYFGAPLIASFYSNPRLEPLMQLASSITLIQAIGYTQYALLRKEFQFRALAIISVGATTLSGIAGVGLALRGYGAWALVWQSLVFAGVTTGLLWIQSNWRPRFLFDRKAGVELGHYGIYLLADDSLNYWTRNGDNLLIGKFLGAHQLGVYALAYRLMMLPLSNISAVVGEVVFPTLAQLQKDLPRFRRTYLTATCAIALISFPLMTGLAALSEPMILALLGDKWADAIPIFGVLCFVGLFQSIVFPTAWIFTSLGKTKAQFQIGVFVAITFVIAVLFGLRYGVLGVAYAYAAWALLTGLLWLHLAGKYLELTAGAILLSVARIGLMAGIMGMIVFGLDSTLMSTWPSAVRLAIGVPVGVSCYLVLCLLAKDETFAELTRLVFSIFNRSSRAA